jgi:hypothetical protein
MKISPDSIGASFVSESIGEQILVRPQKVTKTLTYMLTLAILALSQSLSRYFYMLPGAG